MIWAKDKVPSFPLAPHTTTLNFRILPLFAFTNYKMFAKQRKMSSSSTVQKSPSLVMVLQWENDGLLHCMGEATPWDVRSWGSKGNIAPMTNCNISDKETHFSLLLASSSPISSSIIHVLSLRYHRDRSTQAFPVQRSRKNPFFRTKKETLSLIFYPQKDHRYFP